MKPSTLADKARAVVALDRSDAAEEARYVAGRSREPVLLAPVFLAADEANAALAEAMRRMPREWQATLARARWARTFGTPR